MAATAAGYEQQDKARSEDAAADQKQFPSLIVVITLCVLDSCSPTGRERRFIFGLIGGRLGCGRLILF